MIFRLQTPPNTIADKQLINTCILFYNQLQMTNEEFMICYFDHDRTGDLSASRLDSLPRPSCNQSNLKTYSLLDRPHNVFS
jgi:hypothetical protein